MNRRFITTSVTAVFVVSIIGTIVGAPRTVRSLGAQEDDESEQTAPARDKLEVLTRGPVHEAFAETVTFDPLPGIVVPKQAPKAIEEVPPDQKPEGDNVAWIPGYWAWDDERKDFLWVSGIWRALPPGRQWITGYWAEVSDGYQWISGYWADAEASEVEYLAEPPESIESGPNVEAPSPDYTWVSGTWVWSRDRYAWRPGYWNRVEPNWLWVPAHYVSTPRGYVFNDGYWDYPVARRGVLFAPVFFDDQAYLQRDFRFAPNVVIDVALFVNHLFCRPRYHHYYFGDYYAADYYRAGIFPWFAFHMSRYGYDPIFAHQRWNHGRNDRDWERRLTTDFQRRREDQNARPPQTFAQLQQLSARGAIAKDKSLAVATPLTQLAARQDTALRFQPLNQTQRSQFVERARAVQQVRAERQQQEATAGEAPTERTSKGAEPAKMKLPKSPVAAKVREGGDRDQVPPKVPAAPKLDTKVEPRTKKETVQPVDPKTVPKPKTGPRPEPREVQPKPSEPRPRPQPREVQPKTEPRPRPQPPDVQPKPVEPRPRPQPREVEPSKPQPRPQPKKETPPKRGESKDVSKDRDK